MLQTVRYLSPTARSFEDSALGWLLAELPDAKRLSLATGYFDGSVLDWLADPLQGLVERGGAIRALVGSNGGLTRRRDLERLWGVMHASESSSLHVVFAEGGIFHPKVFVVEGPERSSALVGSANLTSNGSVINVEAGVVLAADETQPELRATIAEISASISAEDRDDVFAVEADDDLERLARLGIIDRLLAPAPAADTSKAERQRVARRSAGVGTRHPVTGVPPRRPRRPRSTAHPPPPVSPVPTIFGLELSHNDLKDSGTREISLSSSLRSWVERVVGRPIVPGENDLLHVAVEARLAGAPGSVAVTPEPVRIWAAGGSGGTHADVRLVLGTRLRAELDAEAVVLTGRALTPGSLAVFEAPSDPQDAPLRMTVFVPSDATFSAVASHLGRSGRERKRHFEVSALAELPAWP